jgi:uncharacterized protein YcfL
MKKNQLLILIIINVIISSCSSNNETNEISNDLGKLLKSRIYLNLPSDAPNYDEFYQYENGLLKSASGFTHFLGTYTYDNEKLINKINKYEAFSYEYDQNGRLKKQKEIGTNNYIELFYYPNKVITHRFYEFGLTNGIPNTAFEKRELLLDNKGRIIKMTDLAQDQSAIDIEYEIYIYDDNGNITKKTAKYLNNPQEVVTNYFYENIKNPYYYSYKKYYQLTYYLENFIGLSVYNHNGLTPNLIKSSNSTYEINMENNPIIEHKNEFNITYEYFK